MKRLLSYLTIAVGFVLLSATMAQAQVVGRCVDQSRGQSFVMLPNMEFVQEGNPMNRGMAMRDPSGHGFLRLPAVVPWQQAFFAGWNGELIEINPAGAGQIGYCQFAQGVMPPNPYAQVNARPAMDPRLVVQTPNGFAPLPAAIVDPGRPFATPMIASESQTVQCFQQSGGDRARFGDCMIRQMAGQRERQIYDCARQSEGAQQTGLCVVGVLGGSRERQIANALAQCGQRYGGDFSQYPLCLASTQFDGDAGKLLACAERQGQSVNFSVTGMAVCYGAESLDLNPEMQIVAECAVATGGEPYSFAGCAGGQLTARELDKCFTNGVGGDHGCFGRNNDIVRALGSMGNYLGDQFGPSNTMVQTWNQAVNDITHGPGPNNVVRSTLRNVGNEVERAAQNVGREVGRVLPRISIRL